jgi:hypothetical protein
MPAPRYALALLCFELIQQSNAPERITRARMANVHVGMNAELCLSTK